MLSKDKFICSSHFRNLLMKHFFFFASVTDEHEFKEDNLLNIGEFTNEITPLIVVIIMYKNLCKLLNILKYY